MRYMRGRVGERREVHRTDIMCAFEILVMAEEVKVACGKSGFRGADELWLLT